MSEERLQEIRDRLNDIQFITDDYKLALDLYIEVIRLREELNGKQLQEIHKINNYDYFKEMTDNWNREDFSRRCYDLCNEEVDLQQRIDKAIKKMHLIRDLGFDYDGFTEPDNLRKLIDALVDIAEQSIDILRGNDNGSV